VPELGRAVVQWLAPRPGERILDLGCGDGTLTRELAASGAEVLGIDASASQIKAALALGLDARVGDAVTLPFENEFDAVFSNAALHWMKDTRAVLDGVARALRPGGRFVAEMGGEGNVNRIFHALLDALDARGLDGQAASPWVFPDPETYENALEAAGLHVLRMETFERRTELDCAMTDWLEIFAPAFAALLPETRRACFFNDVARRLEPDLFDRGRGLWWVDYVRLRFEAVKS
jgi:trans-aconitate methyltransferase